MPWRIDILFAYSLLWQNLTELQLIRIATRPYKPFWLIGYPKPNPGYQPYCDLITKWK